jgi:hypothetical protein
VDSVGLKHTVIGLVLGIGIGVFAIRYLGLAVYLNEHWLIKLAFGFGCWTVGMLVWIIGQLIVRRARPQAGRTSDA